MSKKVGTILSICFFLCGFLQVAFAGDGSGIALSSDGHPAGKRQKQTDDLQFMGLVDVGKRYVVTLLPGERISEFFCAVDEVVEQGKPLVKLQSDAVTSSIADLVLRKHQIEESIEKAKIVAIQQKQKEKQLKRLDKKLNSEKKLEKEISGYSSPMFEKLSNQRMILAEELEVLRQQNIVIEQQRTEKNEVLNLLKKQLAELEEQKAALVITAPFNGKVFYLSTFRERTPPGGLVTELHDESFFVVRGRVMQHQVNSISLGDHVSISLDFSSQESVQGEVTKIVHMQEERSMQGYSNFEVTIVVKENVSWLQSGMMVSVSQNSVGSKNKSEK